MGVEEGEETVLTVVNRSWDSWDNRPEVVECYKDALRAELTCGCVEAVTSPTSHEMLTLDETLSTGPPGAQSRLSDPAQNRVAPALYGGSLKKYSEVKLTSLPLILASADAEEEWPKLLRNNSDVRVSELEAGAALL